MRRSNISHREFLRGAAGLAGAAAWPGFFTSTAARAAESKGDRPNVAAIGGSLSKDRWGIPGIKDGRGAVVGHQAGALGNMVACCHLCNIAMRLGRKVRWDPVREEFPGDAAANAFLAREQRKPYAIEA